MSLKDYYHILGLPREASLDDIKSAYRKLALKFHPDINANENANENFVDINEAYRILSNVHSKKYYDYLLNYFEVKLKLHKVEEAVNDKRYGTLHKYPDYRPKPREDDEDDQYKASFIIDNVMFYILILVGCFSIIFSIKDLIDEDDNLLHGISGILFGVTFTGLLIYGWYQFFRKKNY